MTRLIVLSLWAHAVFSGIIAHAPLGYLERQADAIVVGDVLSVTSTTVRSTIVIRVVRNVRGSLPVGSSVSLNVDGPVLDADKAKTFGPRLWFLKGEDTVIPRMVNVAGIDGYSLPAAVAASHSQTAANTSLRGLAVELLSAGRESDLETGTRNQINHYFKSLPQTEQKEAERVLTTTGNAAAARSGAGLLLQRSNRAGLIQLADLVRSKTVTNDVSSALCHYRNPDPAGIAVLGNLIQTTNDPSVLTCALVALKAIHTPATIQPLLAALDQPALEMKYLAVAGLYFAANSGLLPNEEKLIDDGKELTRSTARAETQVGSLPPFDVFQRESATHTAFWRQWAVLELNKLK